MDKLQDKLKKAEGKLTGLVLQDLSILEEYNINKKLLGGDALFYIGVCERLLQKGITVVDEISFVGELESLKNLSGSRDILDIYEKMGGYNTIRELSSIIDKRNAEGIISEFEKWNVIKSYKEKGILDIDMHWDKLCEMNPSEVYGFLDHELNSVSVSSGIEGLDFENLIFTDEEIDEIASGEEIGLQFNRSPILNGMSVGLPKGELNSISGYINEGKTSFAFSNFVMPIVNNGHKSLIISTEQRSRVFKLMLMIDILTHDLNYYKLTRKKLKTGRWTDEDKEMIKKARKISEERYTNNIIFLKLYDYNTEIVKKAIRKYANLGVELVLYDVLKFGDSDEQVWKSLIDDSKSLFQCVSKCNVAGLVTLQLAMATKNKVRQVGMECVSMSKAVYEVQCECFFVRSAWKDELEKDSPTYLKPYRLKKDKYGKFTSEKEYIEINPDKTYKIVRLGKSRNDSTDKFVLYEVNFDYNIWKEVGFCNVSDKNKY